MNTNTEQQITFLNDRRSGGNRRKPSAPPLFAGPRRRRTKGRRNTDRACYVDIYDIRTWTVSVSILTLSFLDALLTWLQVSQGKATEANPIMHAILRWGGFYPFFAAKVAMTAIPVAVLMMHQEWKLARFAARMCLWSYILIALYHFYLVSI